MIEFKKKVLKHLQSERLRVLALQAKKFAQAKKAHAVFLIKLTVILVAFFSAAGILIPQYKIDESLVIKNPAIKQTTAIVAGGKPIKYSVLVRRTEISDGSYLLKLPKTANNIEVATATTKQIKTLLSAPEQITPLKQRELLAKQHPNLQSGLIINTYQALAVPLKSMVTDLSCRLTLRPRDAVVVNLAQEINLTSVRQTRLSNHLSPSLLAIFVSPELSWSRYLNELIGNFIKVAAAQTVEEIPTAASESPTIGSDPLQNLIDSLTAEPSDVVPPIKVPEVVAPIVASVSSTLPEVKVEPIDIDVATNGLPVVPTVVTSSHSGLEPESEPTSSTTQMEIPDQVRNDNSGLPESAPASSTEFVKIDFETPAPIITEQNTDSGKLVTISDPNENPETPMVDVLASTKIPPIYKVGQEAKIHIKWKNNGDQNMSFQAYDSDADGYLDYVEWTVPHLSEQVFEIIFISKAFQLDNDKNIIADIYSQTSAKDGNYASVADGQYVRATFDYELNSANDITIYAKASTTNNHGSIAVYPVYTDADGNQTEGPKLETVYDGNNPDFKNIDRDGKYRILLTNLDKPTDVFDLKISGDVDIDFIVDPVSWLTGWNYRKSLTVNHLYVGGGNGSAGGSEDETNFPVEISLTGLSNVNASGTDIRFTASDGVTPLAREIESYSTTTGTLVAWVKVPTVSYTVDTMIYVYYGNSSATEPAANSTYGAQNVWTNGFAGVWHLAGATNSSDLDSTSNNSTGTPLGATKPTQTTGQINGALSFNGSTSYVDIAEPGSSLNFSSTNNFSYSAWVKTTQSSTRSEIVGDFNNNPATNMEVATVANSSNIDGAFRVYLADGTSNIKDYRTNISIADGAWHKVGFSYASTSQVLTLFVDGVAQSNPQKVYDAALSGNLYNASTIKIGEDNRPVTFFFNGLIDELGISSVARSAGWIKTEYNNQNAPSSFYATGAEEALVTPASNFTWTNGSGDGKWSTAGNWQGGVVPGPSDTATFSGSATGNCSIDVDASVTGLNIASGYTGIVTMNANLAISGNLTVSAGTLAVGIYNLAVTGNSTVTNGTTTIGVSSSTGWTTTNLTIGAGGTASSTAPGTIYYNQVTVSGTLSPDVTGTYTVAGMSNGMPYYSKLINGTTWYLQYSPKNNALVFYLASALDPDNMGATSPNRWFMSFSGTPYSNSFAGAYSAGSGGATGIPTVANVTASGEYTRLNNSKITISGNFDQSSISSKFLSASSLITVNGNGSFTADGTVNGTQYNSVSLVLNGVNNLRYNNNAIVNNGFNNLIAGQGGSTTTIATDIGISNTLTIGSGSIAGSAYNFWLTGANPLSFDTSSRLAVGSILFRGTTQIIPTLINGYDSTIQVSQGGTTVTQTGNIVINGVNNIYLDNIARPAGIITWNTAGYNLSVGGNIKIGAGSDSALKKLDANGSGGRNSIITVGGNWLNYGTATGCSGTCVPSQFIAASSTVVFNATSTTRTITNGSTTSPFYNLTINGTSSTFTLTDNARVSGDLTVTNSTLAIGTNDLLVTGNSIITNGTTSIGASANTGWTTNNLTLGANGIASSTAGGTVYYNQVTVSGTLSPNAAGVYTVAGMYNGAPYYTNGTYYIWWRTTGNWRLSDGLGVISGVCWYLYTSSNINIITGSFAVYNANETGEATVSNVTASGEYTRLDNSKITVNGIFDQSNTNSKFLAASSLITINGNGSFTADGTLNSLQYNGASVTLNGSSTLSYNNLANNFGNGFNNLTTGQSGGTTTLSSVGLTVKNQLSVGSGTFNGPGYVFLAGSAPLNFNVSSHLAISSLYFLTTYVTTTIPTLTNGYDCDIIAIGNPNVIIQTGDVTLNNSKFLGINGNNNDFPTTWKTDGYNLTVGGNIQIGTFNNNVNLQKLDATHNGARTSTITVGGNWLNYGTATINGRFVADNSTVILTSTSSSAKITSGSSTSPFYNLTINGAGGTYTLQDALAVAHNLTLTNGTLDTKLNSNYPVTIGSADPINGDFSQTTTAKFLARSSVITLNGNGNFTADGTIDGTQFNGVSLTLNGINTLTYNNLAAPFAYGFNNLTVGQGGSTTTLASHLAAINTLTIGSGTLSGTTRTLFVLGANPLNFDVSSRLAVGQLEFIGANQTIPALVNGYDSSIYLVHTSGTVTQTGNVIINSPNTLTIGLTSAQPERKDTWNTSGYNLTVGGNLQIGVGNDSGLKTLDATGAGGRTSTITISGNWLNYGNGTASSTFISANSTVIFNSTTTGKTITSGAINSAFYNVNFAGVGGAYTLQDNFSVLGDLNVVAGVLNAGTYNLAVTGNSTVSNATTTIGISAGTGWTTNNLTIGANGTASSTANGTIYYNQVIVSGTLNPDATGTYTVAGMYGGKPYYRRGSDSWYLSWRFNSVWDITPQSPEQGAVTAWRRTGDPLVGNYYPVGSIPPTGTATVANVTASGEYARLDNSKITIAGNFDQSNISSKFLAASSLITVNGNGNFSADGTLDSTQYNNSILVLNGTNTLAYVSLANTNANGFNKLVVGQNGNTTEAPGLQVAIQNLTVGSGTLHGSSAYFNLLGPNPLTFDTDNSSFNIYGLQFFGTNQTIPALTKGYNCHVFIPNSSSIVTQTGNVNILSPRSLFLGGYAGITGTGPSRSQSWKTDGYNLTVGGSIQIGNGSDTGLKTLNAFSGATSTRNSTITVGGNWLNYGNGSAPSQFIAGSSTVVMAGTSASGTIISGTTTSPFYNLTINGVGGTYTSQDKTSVSGTLTVTAGTLAIGTNDLAVTGASTINGALTLGNSSSTGWTTGDLNLGASGTITSNATTYYNQVTVSGTLSPDASGTYTVSGTANGYPRYVKGAMSIINTGTGLWRIYTDATNFYYYKISAEMAGAYTNFNGSTGVATVANVTASGIYYGVTSDVTISGNYTQTAGGYFNAGPSLITQNGNGNFTADGNNDNTKSAQFNNASLVLNGNNTLTYNNNSNYGYYGFNNLTVGQGGSTTTIASHFTVKNILTIGSGTLTGNYWVYLFGANPLSVDTANSAISIGFLAYNGTSQTIPALTKGYGCSIEVDSGNDVITQTGAVVLNGTGLLNVTSNPAGIATWKTDGYNLTVGGRIQIGVGSDTGLKKLDATGSGGRNSTITVGGNWLNYGNSADPANSSRFIAASSTVIFNKISGTQTLNAGANYSSSTFYNLTHSGAGILRIITNPITITNNFTNSAGTFDANGQVVNVGGNWNNTATYLHGTSTVNLIGSVAQAIMGTTTFYNLVKTVTTAATLTFEAAKTQVIAGTLTLQGAANQLLTLVSSVPGTAWFINPLGSVVMSFLNISDAINSSASPIVATFSKNLSNNPNITFSATTVTWTGASSTDWNTAGNWDTGYVPNTTDNVVISSASNQPILSTSTTVNNLTVNSGAILAIGTNNMTVTGNSIINGTTTIGISAGTGWTTNNLTIGAGGVASSTANGTIYYNQVTVSGTLSPDVADTYTVVGIKNGYPDYASNSQHNGYTYHIWRYTNGNYYITPDYLVFSSDPGHWVNTNGTAAGTYPANSPSVTGSAIVANVNASGEYTRMDNSKITIAGNFDQSNITSKFLAASSLITVNGNGTFIADGTVNSTQYNSASLVLNGNNTLTYGNLTANWANGFNSLTTGQGGATTTLASTATIRSLLTVGSGALTGNASLSLLSPNPLSFNVASILSINLLYFNGGSNQTIPTLVNGYSCNIYDYHNGQSMQQTGDVVLNAGKSLYVGNTATGWIDTWKTDGYNLTVGGNLTIGYGADTGLKKLDATNYSSPGNRTSTITIGGNWFNYGTATGCAGSCTPSSFIAASSTVIFNATSTTRTITSGSSTSAFYNLTINGTSSTFSLVDNLSVAGNLNVTAGTLAIGVNNLAVTGSSTINSTLTLGNSSSTGWTTGDLNLGASGTITSNATTYYNQVTVSGTLSPDTAGTYTVDDVGYPAGYNGQPVYKRNGLVGGVQFWNWLSYNGYRYTTGLLPGVATGNVWQKNPGSMIGTYTAAGTYTGTATVANVTASGIYYGATSDVTISGNYTQAAGGYFNAGPSLITVNGNGNFTADGTGTKQTQFNNASLVLNGVNTLAYNNLAAFSTNGFNNLTVGQGGSTTTLSNHISVRSGLTIGSGTLSGSSYVIYMAQFLGALSFDANSHLSISSLNFRGNISLPTLVNGYCSINVEENGTIITQTGSIIISSNLIMGQTAGYVSTWNTDGYNLSVGGNLQIGNGSDSGLKTLNANGSGGRTSTITVGGNWLNYGNGTAPSQFMAASSTVIFNKTSGTQTLNAGANYASSTFYNLTHSGSSTLQLLVNPLTITNNFTNSAGTFDANGFNINVGGGWNNTATYLHGTSTVTLFGLSQAIMGTTTFYNLVKTVTTAATLTFEAAKTQVIAGALTLQGVANQLLTLVSSIPGTSWFINPLGSVVLSYLNISDAINSSASPIIATFSKNLSNNSNITFSATTVTWTGASSTDWNNASNWDVGYVPNMTDNVVIASTTNQPVLSTSTSVNNITVNSGAILAIGTNNMIVTGNSIINGTTTIGISAGTGWTTTNLTIGAGGTASSTANGTIYYNQVTVSGTLSPDASGTYTVAGMYAGKPYYRRGTDNYYIYYNMTGSGFDYYRIGTTLGSTYPVWNFVVTESLFNLPSSSYFNNGTTGTATVANVTASGEYTRLDNSKITIAGNFDQSATSSKFLAASSLITQNGNGTFTADGTLNSTQYNGASLVLNGVNTLAYNHIYAGTSNGFNNLTVGQNTNTTTFVSDSNFAILNTLTVGTGTFYSVTNSHFYLYGAIPLSVDAASHISIAAPNKLYFYASNVTIPALTNNGYDCSIAIRGTNTTITQTGNVVINGSNTLTIGLAVAGSIDTWLTNGYNLTVGGNLQIGWGSDTGRKTLDATGSGGRNSTITVGGNWLNYGNSADPANSSRFISASSTVILTSTSSGATITSGSSTSAFYNLTINGTGGTYTLQDNASVAGALNVTAGTLAIGVNNLAVTGISTINSALTLGNSSSTGWTTGDLNLGATGIITSNATTYYNQVTVSGTLSPDVTGIYTVAGVYGGKPYYRRGTDNYYIYYNSGSNYWDISISVNDGTRRWTQVSGIFAANYEPINSASGTATVANVTASGLYYGATSDVTISGNYTQTAGGYFNAGPSLITQNGNGNFIADGNNDATKSAQFNNASLVLNGMNTLTYGHNFSVVGDGFNNLTTGQNANTTTLASSFTVKNTLTVGTGTVTGSSILNLLGATPLNVVASSSIISVTTLNFYTGVTLTQTIPNITNGYNCNIQATGYGQTINQLGDIKINGSNYFYIGTFVDAGNSVAWLTNGYNLTVGGNVRIGLNNDSALKKLDATNYTNPTSTASSTIVVGGNWTNYGTGSAPSQFTAASSTVIFNKTSGTQTLAAGGNYASSTFFNLTHSGSSTLQLITNPLTVTNNFVNSAGTFDANGFNIYVGGNWNNTATYLHGTSTVTLFGLSQAIMGTTTFYNLVKTVTTAATLTFEATKTQVIAGALTLQGVANQLLTLVSSIPGTSWFINPLGSAVLNFLNITDAVNSSVGAIIATNSKNSSNNSNITFPAATVTWTGALSTDWNTAGNWDVGYVPNATDNVVIASTTNQPVLTTTTSANTLTINAGATLIVGTTSLAIAGTSTINGTLTIGTSAGAGWTTGDLILGASSTITSNATTYYNQVTVSGTLSPDVTGTYVVAGVYNGKPYWKHNSLNWWVWANPLGDYRITDGLGQQNTYRWNAAGGPITNYNPVNPTTGTATVANVTASGIYYGVTSKVTLSGNYTQTAGGYFNAGPSLITVNGNGNFTADGSGNSGAYSTQFNNASLVLNGVNTLTYNNISSYWGNGYHNLTVGQGGSTTTIASSFNIRNILTIGSGSLTGNKTLFLTGLNPLSFDVNSRLSITTLEFFAVGQTIPTLVNGYDCNMEISTTNASVTQTGNVTFNNAHYWDIGAGDNGNAGHTITWNTNGYDLTVGGTLSIGAGSDTGVKKLDATGSGGRNSTITVGGNWLNYGNGTASSTFVAASSTVIFNATTARTITNGSTTSPFYNLTINGAGGTFTLTDNASVAGNLNVATGTLAVGANNLAVTGSSTINGTLTLSNSANTGWTTGDLNLGASGTITSNATTYYNQVTVSGTLSPDVSGTYTVAGVYGGKPYYRRGSDNYYIWYWSSSNWLISTILGSFDANRWLGSGSITGGYSALGSATGTATVANVTASGIYYGATSDVTISGNYTQAAGGYFNAGPSLITVNGNGNFTADGNSDATKSQQFNNASLVLNGVNTLTYGHLLSNWLNGFKNLTTGQSTLTTTLASSFTVLNTITIGSGILTGSVNPFVNGAVPFVFDANSQLTVSNIYLFGNTKTLAVLSNGYGCNLIADTVINQGGDIVLNSGKNLIIASSNGAAGNATTWNTNGYNLTVGGNLQIGAGSDTALKKLDATGSGGRNSTITVGGSWLNYGNSANPDNSSRFIAASSTVIFNSTTTGKTITTGSSTPIFNAVQFNGVGGAWTLQDNFVASSTSVTNGTLVDNGKTVTVNGNILIGASSILTSSGTWIQGASGNISNSVGTNRFFNLTMAGAGVTSTMTNDVWVARTGAGTLTMGPGTLNGGNYNLYLWTQATNALTVSSLNIGTALAGFYYYAYANQSQKAITLPNNFATMIVLRSIANITATGDFNFGNNPVQLFSSTGAPTGYLDMASNRFVSGPLVFGAGNGGFSGYLKLSSSTSHSIASIARTDSSATSNVIDFGSSTTSISGNVNLTGFTVTPGYSTVNLTGTSTQTITSNGQSFYNLTHFGSGTMLLADSLVATGAFNHTAGTLNPAGWNINSTGNFTIADGAQVTASGLNSSVYYNQVQVTGTLTPDATGVYTYAGMYNGKPYWKRGSDNWFLSFNGGATYYISSIQPQVGNYWGNAGHGVDWSFSLTPAGSYTGTATVANVTASGFIGSTLTVGGNFNVTGHSGALLTLNPSNTWYLNVAGVATANYVNVAYSNASGGHTITQTNSTDSGHNINWIFDQIAPTTTATAVSNSSPYTFGNWTNGDVTVTISCADNVGGVGCATGYPKYCVDTDNTCTPTTTYTAPITIATSTETYIRYYSADTSNNTESVSSQFIRIDKTTSVISNLAPATGSNIAKSGQTVTFTTDKPSTCRFAFTVKSFDNMASDYSCSVSNSIQMTCTLPNFTYGTQNIYLACEDYLGNKDTVETITSVTYNVPQPPGGFIFWPSTPAPVIILPTTTSSTVAVPTPATKVVPIITINNGTKATTKPKVTITLTPTPDTTAVIISTNPDFSGAVTLPFVASPTGQASFEYDLCQGQASCLNQNYTIYTKFLNSAGLDSPAFSANINLKLPAMNVPTISIGDQIKSGLSGIIEFLNPLPETKMTFPPIATAVPKETPIAFQNKFILTLPSMNDFVFATLPRDFMNIANKFPQVASALKNVGVTRMSDAGQLEVAKVSLPGLAEAAGLAGVANLAIADLTKAEASKVPTNMVFARGGENNLDLNVKLSISNQGTAVQTLNTIQGHPLTLAIKPDQPAKTVKGYLIFKSNHVGEATTEGKLETPNVIPGLTRNLSPRNLTWIPAFAGMTRGAVENENDFAVIPGLTRNLSPKVLSRTEIPDQVRNDSRGVGNDSNTVQSGFISLLATPANAAEVKATVDVGNTANSASNSLLNDQNSPDLVLSQFEYKDNGNGVWTADVASPLVLGQYELRTVVEYKNVTVKPETVSMVVVVDPEGYVFQKLSNGKETRIPDATVSIYWLNPATNKYELWSAKNFRQENPQITDVTGRYAYLVPAGDYYLTAKAVGYGDYQSEIFKVQENKGVFMNIELKEKFSLAGWFNLQTILLGGILAVMSGILLTLILLLVAKRRKVV